jgi:ABA responsive element binding factor
MGAKAMSSHGSGAAAGGVGGGGAALSRQGSVCSLTFGEADGQLHGVNLDDLLRAGRKTVDEVWRDIQGAAGGACPRAQMTLEDLLSRAGTNAPGAAAARGWGAHQLYQPAPAPPQLGHHHHHQQPAVGRPVPRPLGVGAGPVLDALYYESGAAAAAGGNRAVPERGVAERSNDRRKKRMIKNRESAARSRARKQVPTCSCPFYVFVPRSAASHILI